MSVLAFRLGGQHQIGPGERSAGTGAAMGNPVSFFSFLVFCCFLFAFRIFAQQPKEGSSTVFRTDMQMQYADMFFTIKQQQHLGVGTNLLLTSESGLDSRPLAVLFLLCCLSGPGS